MPSPLPFPLPEERLTCLSCACEPRTTASPRFSIGERGSEAGSVPWKGPGLPLVRGEVKFHPKSGFILQHALQNSDERIAQW